MRLTLSDDERLLVALRRAVIDYGLERTRWDQGKERVHDEEVYLQLHNDQSASVWVEPSGKPAFRVLVLHSLGPCSCKDCGGNNAAELVETLRSRLESERIERDGVGFRRTKRVTPRPRA